MNMPIIGALNFAFPISEQNDSEFTAEDSV